MATRNDRNERFFGKDGQEKIAATRVALVGAGGLGAPLAQQLGYLGVKHFTLIDHDRLDVTSLNRHVGSSPEDVGKLKVHLVERLLKNIDETIVVDAIPDPFLTERAMDAVKGANWAFGCVDNDATRFVLNELCVAWDVTLMDLASDVPEGAARAFGGRLTLVDKGQGCLRCRELLDLQDVQKAFDVAGSEDRQRIYGVNVNVLGEGGPSVVALNSLIVSLAVIDFMCSVTGLREGRGSLSYRDDFGRLIRQARPTAAGCIVCAKRGTKAAADVERYLRKWPA